MIIAFTGIKGSGKGTAASCLVTKFGFQQIDFADPVRQIVNLLFNVSMEELTDRILKEKPLNRWPFVSPRKLMQEVGKKMRELDPDIFIRCLTMKIDSSKDYVISDLRFPNEFNALNALGAEVIKIINPKIIQDDFDISETSVDHIPSFYRLVNSFSSPELFQQHVEERLMQWNLLRKSTIYSVI